MRANQIVEGLSGGTVAVPFRPPSGDELRVYKERKIELAQSIVRVEKFDFQDLRRFDDANLTLTAFEFLQHKVLPAPFPEFWCEGHIAGSDRRQHLFGCFVSNQQRWSNLDAWAFYPLWKSPGMPAWYYPAVVGLAGPEFPGEVQVAKAHDFLTWPDQEFRRCRVWAAKCLSLFLSGIACLRSPNVRIRGGTPPPKVNQKRRKNGRPPLFDYKTVEVVLQHVGGDGPVRPQPTRSSPRMHWRRGHVRTLHDGRLIPIPPCLVGSAELGFVDHDYRVR